MRLKRTGQRLTDPSSDINIKDTSRKAAVSIPPDDSKDLHEAPYPLPRNFGLGHSVPYLIDNEMVSALCATERTEPQFRALLEQAGLKLTDVFPTRGLHSVFEATLV
jgi:hypothetical protein